MLELLGNRRHELLKLLLREKAGLTVDELSRELNITRNAVRQHLAGLVADGLVAGGATRATGGRPERLYNLTDAGRESFPRRYSWFAGLMVESILSETGIGGLRKRLTALGASVARKLRASHPGLNNRKQKIEKLALLMEDLGYDTGGKTPNDHTIEAFNCVFHDLAKANPDVCQFDLALLSTFTDSKVEHVECMAKGGNACRFKFVARS
jgi:predicted ArsR family transcriptional regulator